MPSSLSSTPLYTSWFVALRVSISICGNVLFPRSLRRCGSLYENFVRYSRGVPARNRVYSILLWHYNCLVSLSHPVLTIRYREVMKILMCSWPLKVEHACPFLRTPCVSYLVDSRSQYPYRSCSSCLFFLGLRFLG